MNPDSYASLTSALDAIGLTGQQIRGVETGSGLV